MKTILVTGSTGFLGKHLVNRLLEAEPDSKLRLMCRKDGPCEPSERVEIVTGDIRRREDVKRAVEGADELYHLAGQVIRSPKTHWDLYDIHVEGARNVCEAMRDSGVSKAVVVSTSGAIAVSQEPVEHTEDSPYPLEVARQWPYYLSKIYAERLARWYIEHRRLPIVIVNPSLLLGPGDERRSSTGDVELFLKGQILVIPTGGLNLVDVRDAAEGCRLAMAKGRIGERYLLGGANMTFHEWIRRASKISGARAPKIMFPVEAARFGAAALRRILPLVGKQYALDDASVQMSAYYWYCDSTKARDELGFKTRDPNETLKDTIEYLRAQQAA